MSQDPATLDQLRVLVAIAETGSFSAAGRRLRRVQSAVSHAVAQVEAQLGTPLFERGGRRPTWTPAGEAVLTLAREVCARADRLRELADGLRRGEEPTVAVAVDVMYPFAALTEACRDFAGRWPAVQLRLYTDALGAVAALVRDGPCTFGVIGPAARARGLVVRPMGEVRMVPVAAPTHPLARLGGVVPLERLVEEVQIVLSERAHDDPTPDQGVFSRRTWRVHDLHTKQGLLREGLGWGNLPADMITEDLAAGRLVTLHAGPFPAEGLPVLLSAVHRPDAPPGPAGRWLMERLTAALRGDTSTP